MDSFAWYKGLYEYSRPDGEELGSDGDLVSSMITTAIIPRICKILEGGALDVYSEKHVKRMVDFTEEVEASVEPNNVKIQVCFIIFEETPKPTSPDAVQIGNQPL